jgi:hypothetical protein
VVDIQLAEIAGDVNGRATTVCAPALFPARRTAESDRTRVALYPPPRTVSALAVNSFASGIRARPLQILSDFPTASHWGPLALAIRAPVRAPRTACRRPLRRSADSGLSPPCCTIPMEDLSAKSAAHSRRLFPAAARSGREQASVTCLPVAGRHQPAIQFTAGTIAQPQMSCQAASDSGPASPPL